MLMLQHNLQRISYWFQMPNISITICLPMYTKHQHIWSIPS